MSDESASSDWRRVWRMSVGVPGLELITHHSSLITKGLEASVADVDFLNRENDSHRIRAPVP